MIIRMMFLIAFPITLIRGTELLLDVIDEYIDGCDDSGEVCIDHEQCCGGCCYNGECIDTYGSCSSAFDVCKDHICMGTESCVVYVPPECPACEPLPLCRIV